MNKETAERASDLLKEIEELSKYKKFLNNKEHGKVAHVVFVQHYGNLDSYTQIDFDVKWNDRFIPVIEKIISDLKTELESL